MRVVVVLIVSLFSLRAPREEAPEMRLDVTTSPTTDFMRYPGLGDEKPIPASLSPRVVDGFLRKKLGYKGLVITDDLTMGAITHSA